jgi:hypothetical protein
MSKHRARRGPILLALFVGLAFSLGGAGVARASTPVVAPQQAGSCISILMEAAGNAGIPGSVVDSTDNGNFDCSVSFDHMDGNGRFLERSMLFIIYEGDAAEEPCGNPSAGTSCRQTTFHGYPAAYYTFGDVDAGNTLAWNMPRGSDHYRLGAHVGFSGVAPEAYAQALWSVAEDRLPVGAPPNPAAPNDPSVPSVPSEAPAGTSDNTLLFGVPPLVALGNLAVPLAGAAAGTLLALGLSTLSSASSTTSAITSPATLKVGDVNDQGMVWSERPWDEAGPGYVPRAEYERTRSLRAQGYQWSKDGWQTPAEQQSQQWDANNKGALNRADADWKAQQQEQLKQLEARQAEERRRLVESYLPPEAPPVAPAPAAPESVWQFNPSLEAGKTGDLGNIAGDGNLGGSVAVYETKYYDMPDKKDDISLFGWDLGNYKCDVQIGKVQAGAGASIDPDKPKNRFAGVGGSASAIQGSGEMVLGNKYLGLTLDSTVDGPKGEAFVGYKDGTVGGTLGVSAGSVDSGIGVNLGGVNVSARAGLNAGMEFGLKLGAEGEVKLGPFKLGYSLGWAKTGT